MYAQDICAFFQKHPDTVWLVGNEAAFKFAKQLTDKGFKKVCILNSFYDFVWSGFNVKSCSETRNFLVDHPGLY